VNATQPTAAEGSVPVIPWWFSAVLGIIMGVTLTLIRTQRYFFIVGAGVLALMIFVVGILTIRRRQRHAELMQSRTSLGYLLWMLVIIILAGPVHTIYLADEPTELWLKSVLLSLGFTVAIRQVDRHLVAHSRQRG